MPLQNIPWAVGGGAYNEVEGARLALYAATSGGRGVMAPRDMRVTALPTPGPAVRIYSGAGVSPNYYPTAGGGQSYAMREISSTDFPVPATGSSGAAVRYLIARVQDEQYEGDTKANPKTDPRNSYQWVSALPTTYPFVELYRLNQPANTATITNAMLTDIRQMANPRVKPVNRSRPSVTTDTGMKLSSTTGEWFPGDGAATGARQEIEVPEWAVRMIVEPSWYGVRYEANSNCYGTFWVSYGPSTAGGANGEPFLYKTQEFQFDSAGAKANTYRTNWLMSDDRAVGSNMRGKLCTFAFRAKRNSASTNNGVSMDGLSGLSLKVTFLEEPDRSTE
ncbi:MULTISPECIES: hypothetical protein [unclassified Brevibacterium]|uniref:hypothetical protein n=1 Tax=unclassified Brevibacterium TaxID=2614124 RepID=UPI001E5DD9DA|nr:MULTISPECIES: hypothetical protein [unclassified Brevibacterium]MCD1286479.1 hypothetical protein [Brevibacterium sp. CCUG 69071]MDK8434286.1 hypothetical protein [Brevibacterium sp. H-BE7]